MKWRDWLENWKMTGLKISPPFLEMEWAPSDPDKDAAWDLYIELLTRVTTQALPNDKGDEKAALDSVYGIFPTTRDIIRKHGRGANEFTKIAIIVLNQIVRPFTAKWHKRLIAGDLDKKEARKEFRQELEQLQVELKKYTQMLADMSGVEDLTALEQVD